MGSVARVLGSLLLALCVGGCPRPAPAQGTTAETGGAARHRVALVLSGGGARGAAHIGVLRVLEEQRVPIDIIVGTSIGAIVGAAYATGMPLADIEREVRSLSTATLFRDVVRSDVPMHRKADDAINYIGPEMGLGPAGLELPKGAVAGVALEAVLRRLTVRQSSSNYDELPIRFRAIATDAVSGEMVVLGNGSLAAAVRASMSVPAAVNPVEIDGRLLVDGGLTRNLPVNVARQLGADVVIAVNIGTPLRARDEILSMLSMSDQMMRIMMADNVRRSLQELGPRDVLIAPDLKDVTTADFDRLGEAAAAGEAAARVALPALARYGVDPSAYAAVLAARTAAERGVPRRIAEVRITGIERVSEDRVRAVLSSRVGENFDAATADADMNRLYAFGDFERVGYFLDEDPAIGHVLTADVTEKSWGPNYLRFGLRLSSDFEGNSFFRVVMTHRRTWLNRLGGEWRNHLQIGHADGLRSEWYQPLVPSHRLFVSAHLEARREPFDIFVDTMRIARYRREVEGGGLDFGVALGTFGDVRVGVERGRVRLLNDTGTIPASELVPKASIGAAVARLRLDTLDNLRFPRSGYSADLRWLESRAALGADDEYSKLSFAATAAIARDAHSLQLSVQAAQAIRGSTLPDYELFPLGGFLQLSGYKTGEFLGRDLRFGRLVYNYRIVGPGLLDGAYLGASVEAGRVGEAAGGTNTPPRLRGNAFYVALDTPLGPVYLGYGRASSNNQALYFYLGQP